MQEDDDVGSAEPAPGGSDSPTPRTALKVVPMLEEDEHLLRGPAILKRAAKLGTPATLQDAEWMVAHPEQIDPQYNTDLLVFTGTVRESGRQQSVPVLSRISGEWRVYWSQLTGVWTACFRLVVK